MLLMLHSLRPLLKHIRKIERYAEIPIITTLEELLLTVTEKHLVERLVDGTPLAEL